MTPRRAALAIALVLVLSATSFLLIVHFQRPTVNPDCTPQAVQSFEAHWNAEISNASYGNIQNVLNAAIKAAEQRKAECHQ